MGPWRAMATLFVTFFAKLDVIFELIILLLNLSATVPLAGTEGVSGLTLNPQSSIPIPMWDPWQWPVARARASLGIGDWDFLYKGPDPPQMDLLL